MNEEDLRPNLEEIIEDVAPDVDLEAIGGDENFRERFGLDSMDFLTIVERIAEETGVEIPEAHYEQVESVNSLARYVAEQMGS